MKQGQYVYYETNGGIRPVLITGNSAYLKFELEERKRENESDVWNSNHSVLQQCAKDTLVSLRILQAVDIDYEWSELDEFQYLLERMIK
jgi:hypothetical protein